MKQILLICAVVVLVGCGKKEDGNTGVVNPNKPSPKVAPEKVIADPIIEREIRGVIGKPTGELTKADYEKVNELYLDGNQLTEVPKELEKLTKLTSLYLDGNQLTDVTGLEKLTKLEELHLYVNQLTSVEGLKKLGGLKVLSLRDNPDLTKAQIAELQKALPNCIIGSDHD